MVDDPHDHGVWHFARGLAQRLRPEERDTVLSGLGPELRATIEQQLQQPFLILSHWKTTTADVTYEAVNEFDKKLTEPDGAAVRRNLIVVSALTIFLGWTRSVPSNVNAIGLNLAAKPEAFEWAVLLLAVYHLVHYVSGSEVKRFHARRLFTTLGHVVRNCDVRERTCTAVLALVPKSADSTVVAEANVVLANLRKCNGEFRWLRRRCSLALFLESYFPIALGVVAVWLAVRLLCLGPALGPNVCLLG